MTGSEVGEEGGVIGKAPRARIRTWDAQNACQYIQKNIFLPYFKVNYEITYKEVFQSYLRGSSSVNCIYFKFKLKYIFIL